MKTKRIDYVDYFRFFGIFLMIMGHIGFGSKFDLFIHAFHMPMFFFVSGILYKKLNSKKEYYSFIKKKFKTLIIPYLCIGLIHYDYWLLYNNSYSLEPLKHLLWVNNDGIAIAQALWFLTAFFITQVIYYTIDTFISNNKIKNILIIIISLFGCTSGYILSFDLPYSLSASFVGVGLLHLGKLVSKTKLINNSLDRLNIKNIFTILIFGIFITILIFVNGNVNMRTNTYNFIPLFWINAVGASILGLNIAKVIHSFVTKKLKFKLLNKYILSVGRNAILYVAFNQILLLFINKVYSYFNISIELVKQFSILLLALIILYIVTMVINKVDIFNYLFGLKFSRKKSIICYILIIIITILILFYSYSKINENSFLTDENGVTLIDISSISDYTFDDSNELYEIINKNISYLLDEHLFEVVQYVYSLDSNMKNFDYDNLSLEQVDNINNLKESIISWENGGRIELINLYGENASEQSIRPWTHTSFVLATAIRFNIIDYDLLGYSEETLTNMTVNLIDELSKYHCSNYDSGWGNVWQSAEWAENIGYAAWLLWDKLDITIKHNVINMVEYEANRFIDYDIPYYRDKEENIVYEGDTKAEENAWNTRILALVVCMLPYNENNSLWEDMLNKLMLSSTSMPSDVSSSEVINGYTLSNVLNGSNINEDGTVVNHNRIHIDYSATTIEGMIDAIIIYALAGREIPETFTFNFKYIYNALVTVDLGIYDKEKVGHHFYEVDEDGNVTFNINMPLDNDWGGFWYGSYYLVDTIIDLNNLDSELNDGLKAKDWAEVHLDYIVNKFKNNDGSFFDNNENYFVSGETYMSHNICKAYILRLLFNNNLVVSN